MCFKKVKYELERMHWPNKCEFNICLLSYVAGAVVFWRFPYLAYENGGAPFIYIFLFLFLLIGVPLVFLEVAWGQNSNLAPLQAFKAVPAMQGIGICMVFLSASLVCYFGSASYYFLLYVAASFSVNQPWTRCNNTWNSEQCQILIGCDLPINTSLDQGNAVLDTNGSTSCYEFYNENFSTPSIEFWTKNLAFHDNVCKRYPKINPMLVGLESSNILLAPIIALSCFAAAKLILCVISLANHVRLTAKVAYILTPLPLSIMVILLVRSVTLSGSIDGLIALFVPSNLNLFLKPKVWKDACSQVFLSILASSGGLVTWSSYSRFYNKYQIDASIMIVAIPILSLLSTCTVFSIAGFFAHINNGDPLTALQDAKGPLAPLVAYSEVVFHMWGGPLTWGIVVFSVLFLSFSTALFPFFESLLSSLSDAFQSFRHWLLRVLSLLLLAIVAMAAYYGVPCFLNGAGLQVINFFDSFSLVISLIIVALAELLFIFYSFDYKLLYTNTMAMSGSTCLKSHFWSIMWTGITPLVLLGCLGVTVYGLLTDGVKSLAPTRTVGKWAAIAGGIFIGFIFLIILLVAFIKVALSRGSCREKFRIAFCSHSSRSSSNMNNHHASNRNGSLFLSDYTSHRPGRMEMLFDEDDVTTV